ncbi:small, acid-soluble spore protein I [Oceanobacillus oncorhynchi subsp. incaldanensis]|uniref:Small, acid-soluble spore protein I n=2 Tax=Oceanobacillus TaxID=182709 RepID=A0A0A1MLK4_9BACI|nr:small acid-soluble spore protein SspI [Oceanobacillus oncorhynchi]MDM8100516.1 small acid-soluble spore protein SspI [Oceanobacillus oncorhynchi]UUI38284.1 small acid-soluble spore protein SspI [Oceanobacillus oncorhynchi]GIO16993.1 small, acid-soluble spore protein I [Oceanobacillus oncorhynchi subsp. incaldanensis]CEI83953.1 Small, acid-soluble spore protein I [Oceanobacillus oncorhynchi]
MDLNIRKAIYANISNNNQEQLEATIVDAINNGEEKMLPGLGVLFELIWNHSDESKKQEMISSLEDGIQSDLS